MSVTIRELTSWKSILWTITIALCYLVLTIFLLNNQLIIDTLFGHYLLHNKFAVIFSLSGGIFTAFTPIDTWLTILSALLVGVNIYLMVKTLFLLEYTGKVKLSIGGAALVSFIATGCSSCGFSVLSILGIGTSLSFLPFHGLTLHMLSLVFLFFSAFYMLKKIRDGLYCKANK